MEQRTPAWHEARIGRVTGSRIGIVLGHSPFQTRRQLLRNMVREVMGERVWNDSPAMAWGRGNEQAALQDFIAAAADPDDQIIEGGWYECDDDPRIGYSPDAHVKDEYLIEIKCPFSRLLPDVVPDHVLDQVQLGMVVLDLPEAAVHYWTPERSETFWVVRDPNFWLLADHAIGAFLADFQAALLSPSQWGERDDAVWREVAGRYRDALAVQKAATVQVEELKAELESLAGGLPATGGGVRLEYVERQGSVDWRRLAADHKISKAEQDAYRGESTRYARVTINDRKETT